ncbi:DUF58 domain-containing protein [Pseudolysinimonas sp.]|jgi:uncharacterized protein (DUF58 family)|uniref:DUF58 domain-containing protein n=1 Tax=Pseudolysinimonas sp. TaxID=2680009 RepID=UPI003783F7BE
MAVSGWFVLLVAVGVVPVVLLDGVPGAVLWAGVLAAVIAVDLILAGSPAALEFARDLPARLRLGESAAVRLAIANPGRRTVRGVLRDAWEPSAGARPNRHRLTLAAGDSTVVTSTLTPVRRGERRAAHVTVRSFGPLRMVARQRSIPVPGHVRVLPPFTSRKHLPSRLAKLRELDGRTSVMVRGQGTEFDSLREYVRGDDVRSLDWRASARRRDAATGQMKLVVRTWRPERDRRVIIVIDSSRISAARIADEPRLDTAFEAALLLAALATRAGDRVDVLVHDRVVRGRVQGATGADLLARTVDMLAPIDPELLEGDWHAIPELVRGVTNQHALVVLVTPIDTPGASRPLLGMLPQLTRRHTVVVAAVTDPLVVAATRDRTGSDDVYRAASAERALLDVSRVATAIGQTGAEVVTAPPADLPPALADRYLALKAAGRL